MTQRLSQATVRDIAAIIDMIETYPHDADYANIIRIAQDRMQLKVDLLPPDPLPPPGPKPFFSILDDVLSTEITRQINRPFWIDTVGNSNIVEVRVQLEDKVLRVFVRRSQAYASNTHIFLIWMVGTSLVLLMIAIPFLRNQIRPILTLAEAAESFGKGRPMPRDFRPRGAEEVRRAGFAFIQMRERIERQIEQRTAMLTGVSHDLQNHPHPLQAAAGAGRRQGRDQGSARPGHRRHAVDAGRLSRLCPRRGVGRRRPFRSRSLFPEARRGGQAAQAQAVDRRSPAIRDVHVRPNAFARLLSNVVGNAFRYAKTVEINANHGRGSLLVTIDDDGPGIPLDKREDVFKPFVRLDEARNLDASGTGLGLSIARDIARSHGGDIMLDDSPLGGLRAVIKVPA